MNRKEFYESLSEDVKAKIKACETEEEMLKVLDEEKIELDPEILDEANVTGGYCRNNIPGTCRCLSAISC